MFGMAAGYRIIESPHVPREHVGDWIDPIPITRQPRSKRLWKKLRQRRHRNARPILEDQVIVIGDTIIMSPRVASELRAHLRASQDRALAASFGGTQP